MNTVARLERALAKLSLQPNDVVIADMRIIPMRAFEKVPAGLLGSMVIFVRCAPGETPEHALTRMPREEAAKILKQIVFPQNDEAQSAADWERTCGQDL